MSISNLKNFYFTFGTSRQFPFQEGWVIVQAQDILIARKIFLLYFPSENGWLNCSAVYTEEEFKSTKMYKEIDKTKAGCHLIIGPHPLDWNIKETG